MGWRADDVLGMVEIPGYMTINQMVILQNDPIHLPAPPHLSAHPHTSKYSNGCVILGFLCYGVQNMWGFDLGVNMQIYSITPF